MRPSPHPDAKALAQFAAGLLSGRAQKTVEIHLTGCEECGRVLQSLGDATAPAGHPAHAPAMGTVHDPLASTMDEPETNPAPAPIPSPAQESVTRAANGDPQPGEMLGEYRVLEPLGQGGMGVLYRGEQPIIGKQVAIKVIRRAIGHDAESVQQLIDEARAVNAIRHPNIVDIFSFGKLADDRPYMVMELLEGMSLAQLLEERGKLTAEQTLTVLSQALAALEAAHAVGVIHRDVKPENIMVNPRRDGWRVTLLDFGLAKRSNDGSSEIAGTASVMGTPAFIAPELLRREPAGAAADIYSLGILAWKLLAGRGPFEGGTIPEVLHRHLKEPPPPLRKEAPEVPEALEALVLEMMAKTPRERPTTSEARKRVDALLTQGAAARAAEKSPLARRVAMGAGAAVVALALSAAAWAIWSPEPAVEVGQPLPVAHPAPPPDSALKPAPNPPTPPSPPQPDPVAVKPEPASDPVPFFGMRWPCGKIATVTPLYEASAVGKWQLFQITFEYEAPLLVAVQGKGPQRVALKKMHAAVKACKGTPKVIQAAHTKPFKMWWTDSGLMLQGGVSAHVDDVTLIDPPK